MNLYQDRLFFGMTQKSFELSTVLFGGWFWARSTFSEQQLIYRGRDGKVNPSYITAYMDLADSQVTINSQALPANSVWHYLRTQIRACGRESDPADPCVIYIDENGDMIAAQPNRPQHVSIQVLAGGTFKLRWIYQPAGQQIRPDGFRIYTDSGAGFDFSSPTVSVGYTGAFEYNWTSGAYSHGTVVKFVVRAYNSDAGETQHSQYISAVADDTGPAAIQTIRASLEVVD